MLEQKELDKIQKRIKTLKTNNRINNHFHPKLNPKKEIDALAIALDLFSSVMLGFIVGFTLDKLFNVPFGDIKSLAFRRREDIMKLRSNEFISEKVYEEL